MAVAKNGRVVADAGQGAKAPVVLTLHNLHRTYGAGAGREALPVLRGAELELRAGEAVAIIGPSGSGKTTLLQLAGLLDTPDLLPKNVVQGSQSQVVLAGETVVDAAGRTVMSDDGLAKLRNRACGYVYQFHHLLKEFTARENVLMPARVGGFGGKDVEARADRLLALVGLEARKGHFPDELSGGEQQRVALARALANAPKLLLADEPTGNLDPHTADAVADLLFGLVKTEKLALLMVTHNPALAAKCHRVLRMEEGVLVRG